MSAGSRAGCTPSASRNPRSTSAGIGGLAVAGVETAQVRVELPVGEAVRDPVRPVQRERGLPDPGGPADRGDDDPGGPDCLVGRRRVEDAVEQREFLGPPREVRHPRRQLPRYGHAPGGLIRPVRVTGTRRVGVQRLGVRCASVHCVGVQCVDVYGAVPGPVPRDKVRPGRLRQTKRPHKRTHGRRIRLPRPPALKVGDGAHGHTGPLRQVLLSQASSDPLLPQPFTRARLTGMCTHDHPPTRDHPVTESLTCPRLQRKLPNPRPKVQPAQPKVNPMDIPNDSMAPLNPATP